MTELRSEVSRGAWVRGTDSTYGRGRYPFGKCSECDAPACHNIPAENGGARLVCQEHKGKLFFVPFLGQQTKIFTATERWVLAGGGAGGAKTYAGSRLWLKQWAKEHARWKEAKREGREFSSKGWAIFFRRTMPELIQVIEDFKKYCQDVDKGGKWNEQQKLWVSSCGYKVQFGGMEDESSYLRFYGGEYTLIVFDEATQFTKKQIVELDARLRCSDPVLDTQVQLYLLTNPVGGATKAWLRKRYVKRAPPETRVKIKVKLADGRVVTEYQVYIPSNLYDNPALVASGRYEASLMLKGAAMKRALLLNDWDVDEGCWVGEDWDPSVHIVDPHPLPADATRRFKMFDWGSATRAACHWGVMIDAGMVIYRSVSWRRKTAAWVARDIKRIESRPLLWKNPQTGQTIKITGPEWDEASDCSLVNGPLDGACWAKQGHDLSLGEIFETAGTGFYRSEKGAAVKHAAADRIRTRLQARYPDYTGTRDLAGLRFFRDTTECWIKDDEGADVLTGPTHTIPLLPIDPNDPDLWDSDADDHDMDALAYGETSRPAPDDSEDREDAEIIDFMVHRRQARGGDDSDNKIDW